MPDYPDTIKHRVTMGDIPAYVEAQLNPYGEDKCPECGRPLSEVDRATHHVEHWGRDPLPVLPNNYLARARRAWLLQEPLPEA